MKALPMFEYLVPQAPDAIMALMEACKADTRTSKVDLGVGVYKDDAGGTPILRAVKAAEKRMWETQATKTYVGTTGSASFRATMLDMMFGEGNPALEFTASSQAAGGSGALRLGAEVIKSAAPDATVWVSTPTWANHIPLISSADLKMDKYPYYNRETLGVDFADMLEHLDKYAKRGDVVLLHGCCHNPTGADLSPAEWDELAPFLRDRGLTPYIDLAYFGLGRGMEEDTYGLRKILEICPEALVAASCSLYCLIGLICCWALSQLKNTSVSLAIMVSATSAARRRSPAPPE